jgi:hypothetical protein
MPPKPKSPQAMQPMTMDGDSAATAGSIKSRDAIGDMFLVHISKTNPELSERWGTQWGQVPEEHACSNELHEYTAQYLTTVYIIPAGRVNAGQHLSQDVAQNTWGGLIYDLRKRFQHSCEQSTKVNLARALLVLSVDCLPASCAMRNARIVFTN